MKKTLPIAAVSAVSLLALVAAPRGRAAADEPCHRVRATIQDALVSDGCPSPVGLCTAGTLDHDGVLNGSVYTVVNALAPAATPGVLSFDTSTTISTGKGNVVFHGSAVFDPVHGAISILLTDPVGTGRFAGATGRLFVHADTTPASAQGEIEGEICLAE
jgi:hypothetical protein